VSHAEQIVFGGLIVFFLIKEPHGIARLWSTGKEKLQALAVSALMRVACVSRHPGQWSSFAVVGVVAVVSPFQ
jgi:hypothetical protein